MKPSPVPWAVTVTGPEERYADHGAYVCAVTRAARALRTERFLLDEDVAAATAAAQAASVP